MIKTITAMQARKNFGDYLNKVSFGQQSFIIERQNAPMAALISIDELEDLLEINNPRIQEKINATEKEMEKGDVVSLDEL